MKNFWYIFRVNDITMNLAAFEIDVRFRYIIYFAQSLTLMFKYNIYYADTNILQKALNTETT